MLFSQFLEVHFLLPLPLPYISIIKTNNSVKIMTGFIFIFCDVVFASENFANFAFNGYFVGLVFFFFSCTCSSLPSCLCLVPGKMWGKRAISSLYWTWVVHFSGTKNEGNRGNGILFSIFVCFLGDQTEFWIIEIFNRNFGNGLLGEMLVSSTDGYLCELGLIVCMCT